jgi:hypothetical protein
MSYGIRGRLSFIGGGDRLIPPISKTIEFAYLRLPRLPKVNHE